MENTILNEGNEKVKSTKEIVLMHLQKISNICCNEFVPSFIEKRPVKIGDGVAIAEIYHPDMREAFSNSVGFLCDVIIPYSDEEFTAKAKTISDEEAKHKKNIKEKKVSEDKWIEKKMDLRRTLFQEINFLIERIDFFSNSKQEEEQ